MDETRRHPDRPATTGAARAPLRALAIAFLVFGTMGLTGAVATTLVPAVRESFGLSLSAAMAVQWIGLVVSGLCSLPFAQVLHTRGPEWTAQLGLTLLVLGCAAVGAAMQVAGHGRAGYAALLAALALVALGNTALQVAANLLIARLGPRSGVAARLTLAQGFNSLGVLAGVHAGASALGGSDSRPRVGAGAGVASGAAHIYFACAGICLIVLLLALASHASPGGSARQPARAPDRVPLRRAFGSGWALAGAGAIALYVGAEGAIGSILISYLHQPAILGMTLPLAGRYVANVYWGGALAGRFIGGWLLSGRSPPLLLAAVALLAAAACLGPLAGSGLGAAMAALGIGLLNAIMFPVIFAITLERADAPPAAVSGLLSTAIGGGALISIAVGEAGDRFGIGPAFAVPLCAYVLIAVFALLAAVPPQDPRMTRSVGRRSDLT